MTSPPPPPPLKQRPDYGRNTRGCGTTVFIIVLLGFMGLIIFGTYKVTTYGMQASGWNCAWRKWGEAQGWKQDVPAEQSTYCKGHQ